MPLTYRVERDASGWIVCEDAQLVSRRDTAKGALETAYLLTLASKATGHPAVLLVGTSGKLTPFDVNEPLELLSQVVEARGHMGSAD